MSSTSPGSGNLPDERLENSVLPPAVTSKSPVAPFSMSESTPSFFFNLSARATALGL